LDANFLFLISAFVENNISSEKEKQFLALNSINMLYTSKLCGLLFFLSLNTIPQIYFLCNIFPQKILHVPIHDTMIHQKILHHDMQKK